MLPQRAASALVPMLDNMHPVPDCVISLVTTSDQLKCIGFHKLAQAPFVMLLQRAHSALVPMLESRLAKHAQAAVASIAGPEAEAGRAGSC